MPTFVPGSGALGLVADINEVAYVNGCATNYITNYSLYSAWNSDYQFAPEFNAPYNMGFFYGQGCYGSITVVLNFYADPYNDNMASWGLYFKVGTTGTETLIDNLASGRAAYNECVEYNGYVSTKGGLGQSGNTVYIGVRAIGKTATPAYFDSSGIGSTTCPDTLNFDYGGTYDYPGACPAQYSDFLESATVLKTGITVAVDKSGFVSTC